MAITAQFGIRALFMLTTACAVLVWAVFSPPQWLGLLALHLVHLLAPAAILSGIVFHRGNRQAFFIGCAAAVLYASVGVRFTNPFSSYDPWLLDFDAFLAGPDMLISAKVRLTMLLALYAASGAVAVLVRRWALVLAKKNDAPQGN